MGRTRRPRPARLGKKLLEVRTRLGLSQVGMCEALDFPQLHPAHISAYETGKREPGLLVIAKYAELAGCSTDYLIIDKLDLPAKRCKRMVR
jgi:transcriptional regulator with XRE-family HTH domain